MGWPIVAAMAMMGSLALAQSAPAGLSPDQLLQLQRAVGSSGSTVTPGVTPRETILEPTAPSMPQPTSELEKIFSDRAGQSLKLFGYDQLGVGRPVSIPQVGAVQDTYVLGVGDEIVLTLRGQENTEYRTEVNRDGNVVFPKLAPLPAAGRSFGQFRQQLLATIHNVFVSTEAFVTVGRLRQISVMVSGEVGSPGVRTLTGLSTVTDAVFVSGGIRKAGSLRSIRLVRGGRVTTVDLYGVVTGSGSARNITLANGDQVIVPPIGATFAVAGDARRAAIYELPAGRTAISVREAVRLAAGTAIRGAYSISLLRTEPDGRRLYVDVSQAGGTVVRDGEIIRIRTTMNVSLNQITLTGAVRTPGLVASGRFKTLHDLMPSSDMMQPGAYMLFAFIDRVDPVSLQRTVIPFSPLRVVTGRQNIALMSDDVVHILSKAGMRALVDAALKPPVDLGTPATDTRGLTAAPAAPTPNAPSASQIEQALRGNPALQSALANDLAASQPASNGVNGANGGAGQTMPGPNQTPGLGQTPRQTPGQTLSGATTGPEEFAPETDLGGFKAMDRAFLGRAIGDYRVTLSGAVVYPGTYLALPGTTVAELLSAAGGFAGNVDLSKFELTSTVMDNQSGVASTERKYYPATPEQLAAIALKSYDDVQFRQVYSDFNGGFVVLKGEVRYPGTYSIVRGERLSSVLQRAGGLTNVAYPYGAVFTRKSVAEREASGNARTAADMRSQLLDVVMRPSGSNQAIPLMTGDTLSGVQSLIAALEHQPAVGRVAAVADPAELARRPQSDILLEAGDMLVVPQKPSTVTVLGEVMQPGTFIYDPGQSTDDLIRRAGGFSAHADRSRTIIVLPDGTAELPEVSWLSFGSDDKIVPGTTIVVPRDVSALTTHQALVDFTAIFSQLATSAAALAVLSKY